MGNRVVPVLLLALLVVLHAQLWLGRGSVRSVNAMNADLRQQLAKNSLAQQANNRLEAEVRDLREGLEMVEERARLELGMVKANEIFVHVNK